MTPVEKLFNERLGPLKERLAELKEHDSCNDLVLQTLAKELQELSEFVS